MYIQGAPITPKIENLFICPSSGIYQTGHFFRTLKTGITCLYCKGEMSIEKLSLEILNQGVPSDLAEEIQNGLLS